MPIPALPARVRVPFTFIVFAVGVAFAACSDDDTTKPPVPVEAGADTAAAKIICGQTGSLCAGNEWCAYELVGTCGKGGQRGQCSVRPLLDSCVGSCPAVCGCDGKIYCNACEAQANGADVDKDRGCIPTGGEVLAYALAGDPAKVVIFKKDDARKLCVRLTLVARLGTKYGLDVPADWGIESGEVTHDPADCSITVTGTPPTPSDIAVAPNNGQGRVRFSTDLGQQGKYPCSLSIAARLAFEPTSEYPWVPPVEPIVAENVSVSGACP